MNDASYQIIANGVDVTAKLRDRLVSLTVHDAAGIESDTVTIEIDNRDRAVAIPPTGAALRVSMGLAGRLILKGVFEVDELEIPLDDEAMVIHGKAAKMATSFKSPRDRTYDDITFGDLVEQVAQAHGYTPAIDETLAAIRFEHIDQRGESDMNLLTRLARDNDAVSKPVAERLVVVPKAQGKSVSGRTLPTLTFADPSNSSGRVTVTEHNDYRAAVAYWFDEASQQRTAVTVGSGEPAYTMRKTFKSADAARSAASGKLGELQRGTGSLSLSRPLTPEVVAESHIILAGHAPGANGTWLVETAEHTIRPNDVSASEFQCVRPEGKDASEKTNTD